MKREFLDRTNDYTLVRISGMDLRPRIDCIDLFWFLDGKRNCQGLIVLKYPVVKHLQPLRRPGVDTGQAASNLIPYGK
jgi:hypothetical protein